MKKYEKMLVCKENMCNGCMACVVACPQNAIHIQDDLNAYNAVIDNYKCVDCGVCHKVCPRTSKLKGLFPIEWCQGWAKDKYIRDGSSSGGYATSIMKGFVKQGGYVVSCVLDFDGFGFEIANTIEGCEKFSGSKYVKSNPKHIYKQIKNKLNDNEKVLFVGLPCQVAGLKNYIDKKLHLNLYTIDLICHGTPSPQLIEKYLQEDFGVLLTNCQDLKFRNKTNFSLFRSETPLLHKRVQDRYMLAFMNGLIYTENCYACEYAKIERISDITLGDAWSSEIVNEKKNGISLALCQTEKGKYLLGLAEIIMMPINLDNEVLVNQQLRCPTMAPQQREKFFVNSRRHRFSKAVFKAYPSVCIKQNIKYALIKAKFIQDKKD